MASSGCATSTVLITHGPKLRPKLCEQIGAPRSDADAVTIE
jgi:hypothetical protein